MTFGYNEHSVITNPGYNEHSVITNPGYNEQIQPVSSLS